MTWHHPALAERAMREMDDEIAMWKKIMVKVYSAVPPVPPDGVDLTVETKARLFDVVRAALYQKEG